MRDTQVADAGRADEGDLRQADVLFVIRQDGVLDVLQGELEVVLDDLPHGAVEVDAHAAEIDAVLEGAELAGRARQRRLVPPRRVHHDPGFGVEGEVLVGRGEYPAGDVGVPAEGAALGRLGADLVALDFPEGLGVGFLLLDVVVLLLEHVVDDLLDGLGVGRRGRRVGVDRQPPVAEGVLKLAVLPLQGVEAGLQVEQFLLRVGGLHQAGGRGELPPRRRRLGGQRAGAQDD